MTAYYVKISYDLVQDLLHTTPERLPEGWRLAEPWGPKGKRQEIWLVEDERAPKSVEGHLVTPIMVRNDRERPVITSWELEDL